MKKALIDCGKKSALVLLAMAIPAIAGGEPARRHADSGKGKFIPTYTIIYGDARGARSPEETAKFDMLVSSSSDRLSRKWNLTGRTAWRELKTLNPNMVIVVYTLGPGEYNTASWGQLAQGWDWIKQNHGDDAEDRWTARGINYRTYLQLLDYPNERLMEIGNRRWQDFWLENLYTDYWGGRRKLDLDGVDGLFADNTSYSVNWRGRWHREGFRDQPDEPEGYFAGGKYLHDAWRARVNAFFERAIPWFAERNVTFTLNFANRDEREEWWAELDSQPAPPFAAMDEVGFLHPYGPRPAWYHTSDWERHLRQLRGMRNVRMLVNAHANVPVGEGLEKMDAADPNGMTGWDALWFSMTSFLLGFDDVNRNAYMNFTLWGYSGYFWFDEFDPKYLHLGAALGDYKRSGELYCREFEDGFVVVNPGTSNVVGTPVPAPGLRVLNHSNFRSAEEARAVSEFDLPSRRGVILLKPGRKAGNEDNPQGCAPQPPCPQCRANGVLRRDDLGRGRRLQQCR